MNLKISQVLLEELHFGHNGEFLAKEPTPFAAPHPVAIEVGLIKGDDVANIAVRLQVKSDDEGTQYSFRASYLILFQIEGEPPTDLEKRIAFTGATMLMPFLRELIGTITQRARFGACWLPPANFSEMAKPSDGQPVRRVRAKKAVRRTKASRS